MKDRIHILFTPPGVSILTAQIDLMHVKHLGHFWQAAKAGMFNRELYISFLHDLRLQVVGTATDSNILHEL